MKPRSRGSLRGWAAFWSLFLLGMACFFRGTAQGEPQRPLAQQAATPASAPQQASPSDSSKTQQREDPPVIQQPEVIQNREPIQPRS